MAQNLANDQQTNARIQQYYQRAIDNINKDIDAELARIVDENGNPVNAYKPVGKADMAAYEREAKEVVAQADAMRAQHKHVTYDDFSPEVNQRMRVYNATMRLNRLELLKSQIGIHLTGATAQTDDDLQQKLGDDYVSELKRQAGIMAVTTTPSMWTNKKVAKVVMTQTGGANFSTRLWANQDALKARLDEVIATGIIQGQSPRKMALKLKSQVKDTVDNHRYVTERIARTESSRVQYTAQVDSIKKNGYQFVQWFAELKACSACRAIANQDNGYGRGVYKINKVPRIPDDTHPNCRCSISATWVDGQQNVALSDEEQSALNRYISSDSYKLNDDLRRKNITQADKLMMAALDAALGKMPVYSSSQPLQRDYFFSNDDQQEDFVSQMDNGWFEDSAYISSSKIHYGKGEEQVHVIIKDSKTGRNISKYNSSEKEVLFPRNTRFKVEDFYVNDDGILTVVWSE